MPTYEYQCDACQHQWEEFQSIKAAATRKCPACKKLKAKRLISAGGGLIFKGSGFYITDYRSNSYQKAAEADKASSSAAPSSTPAADSGKAASSGSSPSTSSSKSDK